MTKQKVSQNGKKIILWIVNVWLFYLTVINGNILNLLKTNTIHLIKNNNAYVDSQDQETISEQRGIPTSPGVLSPYRERSVEENLDLFNKMKEGSFLPGECVKVLVWVYLMLKIF